MMIHLYSTRLVRWYALVVASFLLLLFSPMLVTALSLYDGAITSSSVRVDLLASETDVSAKAAYVLINNGNEQATARVSLPDVSTTLFKDGVPFNGELTLAPGQQTTLTTDFTVLLTSSHHLLVSYELLFDGKPNDARISRLQVNLRLPSSDASVVSSSVPFRSVEEDSALFIYEALQSYPLPLDVYWNIAVPKLFFTRSISEVNATNQIMRVQLTLQNADTREVRTISLRDGFLVSNYEPLAPLEQFVLVEQPNEGYYRWEKHLDRLAPGESVTVQYTLTVTTLVGLRLLPARVFVNGVLAGSVDGAFLFSAYDTPDTGWDSADIFGKKPSLYTVKTDIVLPSSGAAPSAPYQTNGYIGTIVWILGVAMVLGGVLFGRWLFIRRRTRIVQRAVTLKSFSQGGMRT